MPAKKTVSSAIEDAEIEREQKRVGLQFDYAWKWFHMHATQRTTMFNYFLIITGILASAYAGILKDDGPRGVAVGLGLIGFITSLAFLYLDCRNRELVRLGEDVLAMLEREYFFPPAASNGDTASAVRGDSSIQLGFLYREEVEKRQVAEEISELHSTLNMPDTSEAEQKHLKKQIGVATRRSFLNCTIYRHKFWIRNIERLIAVCFLALAVVASVWPRHEAKSSALQHKVGDLIAIIRQASDANTKLQKEIRELSIKVDQTRRDNLNLQQRIDRLISLQKPPP